ncbi:MAG: dephospho-CoA kinase [Planctomycetaceae bacterium]|jgi:dephospho-CoA kinase|nr:dephospho-CoA kinase [Planctomycetaceae bacterium]
MILGLVGGIGCGKSLVAKLFAELGAKLIDADKIGHDLLSEETISKQIRSFFGEKVFRNIDGVDCIDRSELAHIVFEQTEEGLAGLKYLNSIIHPRISKIIDEKIRLFSQNNFCSDQTNCKIYQQSQNANNLIILDAPLLLETGFDKITDKIIFIESSRENRIVRILKRNWTENDLTLRESVQLPIDQKRKRADFIIVNDKTIDDTKNQIISLIKKL